jgi:hypothetical protein
MLFNPMSCRIRLSSPVSLRSLRRSSGSLLALIIPWLLAPSPARSQEFEAGYVWASSNNEEFPSARGGEVQGLFALGSSKWRLQFGMHRIWAHTQRESLVCAVYEPPNRCGTEETRDKVRLAGFGAALVRPLLAVSHATLKLGVGLSLNSMTILSSTGLVTHRAGDIYPTSGANAGVFGFLALDFVPVRAAGLAMRLGVLAHWVDFGSCAVDYQRYDPFCTPATFREFQLGLAFSPPR